MKDFVDKATQTAQAGIDKASSFFSDLPVIGDYRDKEMRREADRRLRETIAVSLESARKRIVEIERKLLNKGKLTDLPYVDVAATRMQTLIDRIRTAPSGYAGFFDMETIREPELEQLHQFDQRIAASIPEINNRIDEVEQAIDAGEDYAQPLTGLINDLDDLGERMDHRKEVIRAAANDASSLPETSVALPEAPASPDEPETTSDDQ
jgi:hypothetical protein